MDKKEIDELIDIIGLMLAGMIMLSVLIFILAGIVHIVSLMF